MAKYMPEAPIIKLNEAPFNPEQRKAIRTFNAELRKVYRELAETINQNATQLDAIP